MDQVAHTAAEAMLTTPVRHPLSATVREIRDFFRDDHVHAALIADPAGYLVAVVERDDLTSGHAPDAEAVPLGRIAGRVVLEDASLPGFCSEDDVWARALHQAGRAVLSSAIAD